MTLFKTPDFWIVMGVIVVAAGATLYAILTHKRRMAERDYGFMERDGHPLKWNPESLPASVIYHPDVSLAWRTVIRQAILKFEGAVGRALFVEMGVPPGYSWERPPTVGSGIVAVSSKEAAGELQPDHAFTIPRYTVTSSVIMAVESVFPNGPANEFVAVHEVGHWLGLDHDEVLTSIMYPKLSDRQQPGELSALDKKRLKEAYGG